MTKSAAGIVSTVAALAAIVAIAYQIGFDNGEEKGSRGREAVEAQLDEIVRATGVDLSDPPSSDAAAAVMIEHPVEGGGISEFETFNGSFSDLADGHEIWLFLRNPGDPLVHPQPSEATLTLDNRWTSAVIAGGGSDQGKPFEVFATVADGQATQAIRDYLSAAAETGAYPGMADFPKGVVVSDSITAIRQ